jgi:hypothetical protein
MTTKNESGGDRPLAAGPEPRARKPYTPPELIEYGTVAKLTQTGGATIVDFGGMMGMML